MPISTTAAATFCGWGVSLTGVPLGWLIGAMLCVVAMSLVKFPVQQPNKVMPYVKASVGTMLGASVSLSVVVSLPNWWPSFLFMVVVMLMAGAINYQLMRRFFGFSNTESALSAVPGGITEMILLSETAGGEQWRVAIVHALRIALAILFIPLLIGWIADVDLGSSSPQSAPLMKWDDWAWFAGCVAVGVFADRFKKIPARLILVPLVLCGVLHLTGVSNFNVPTQISNIVQIFIGINVGARFIGVAPKTLLHVGMAAVVVVAVQILFAFGSALLAADFLGADKLVLALSYSPGGLAEMSLIAVAMGQDVAIVGFHHIARVLGALFAGPLILKFVNRE